MNAEMSSLRLFQAGSEPQLQPKDAGAQTRRRTVFGQPLLLEGEINQCLVRRPPAVHTRAVA
jgi:hypothetical protein